MKREDTNRRRYALTGAFFLAAVLCMSIPAHSQERTKSGTKPGGKGKTTEAAPVDKNQAKPKAEKTTTPAEKNTFKLKPGGKGKLCLTCHTAFIDKMKSRFVHTPVKSEECVGCHNPHTSSYGKMLSGDAQNVCRTCHPAVVPEKAVSTHRVVIEGNCMKCHDPHASDNKAQLLKTGNELCFDCHKNLGDEIKKVKFKHSPVEKGCLNCHNPHASSNARFLLKDKVPSLCLSCHRIEGPGFAARHMNYPMAKADCTSCHNVHGSDQGGILFNSVHKPVANRMCNQCHDQPEAANPFALKKAGYELCRGCHSTMLNETLAKKRVHWPLLSKRGCLSCHTPHASTVKGLIKGSLSDACGACHKDSVTRQKRSPTKHEPVDKGQCMSCHVPHASDQVFLLTQPSVIDVCGKCHDWQKHSSHPLGDKIVDPRNKNITVDCLSCHRSHGTEYKHFIYFATTSEMCTQCHIKFKR